MSELNETDSSEKRKQLLANYSKRKAFYDELIPSLKAEFEFELLNAQIAEAKLRRLRAITDMASMKMDPSNSESKNLEKDGDTR